jgi:hypothetical protein
MAFWNKKPQPAKATAVVIDQEVMLTAIATMTRIGMTHDSAIKQEYSRLMSMKHMSTDTSYLNRPSTAGRRKG